MALVQTAWWEQVMWAIQSGAFPWLLVLGADLWTFFSNAGLPHTAAATPTAEAPGEESEASSEDEQEQRAPETPPGITFWGGPKLEKKMKSNRALQKMVCSSNHSAASLMKSMSLL